MPYMRECGKSRRFCVDFFKRALFLRNTPKCFLFRCLFIRLFSETNFGGQNEFIARSNDLRDLKRGATVSSEILVLLARALRFQCLFNNHCMQAATAQRLQKSFTSFLVQGKTHKLQREKGALFPAGTERGRGWH